MARARNIKPGFAKNEDLAECSIAARLCFALLPTLADRDGRLEDRPKRIKGELFPFDSIEVEPMLGELEKHGFIVRYVAEGRGLIQIIAFHKHQNPHHREPESVLPTHPSLRLDADGKWSKPEAERPSQPLEAPDKPRLYPPTSDLPPPISRVDSGALIPDTPLPPPPQAQGQAEAPNGHDLAGAVPSQRMPACPSEAILDLYHERLPALPRCNVLTDAHRTALSVRWREVCGDEEIRKAEDVRGAALDWWGWFFDQVRGAPHLAGRNGRNWRASFDWLVKADNFAKVVNGNYAKQEHHA